jgi:L-alanine-DL-glutamate epimerase-like enolase superfamily enzyme
MKIIKINLFQFNTPFKYSFHSPHIHRVRADSIVVELQFNNDLSGYGESAPRPYVTGETCSTVAETIKDRFAKILFCQEINTLDDVEKTLNILEKECRKENLSTYNSALGSIDIALLDALRQFQGIPLHSFFGPIESHRVSISLSIPFLHDTIIKELYHKLNGLNPDSIKILLGNIENDNIERVKLIRSLFGSEKEIRIEANGKWSLTQAISNIEKLKRFNISGIEQPVTKNDVEGLQEIRNKTGIPIIVDESMCSLTDAKYLIERGACDIVNIKISKCGGLVKSKQIRDYAQSRNVRCQIGAHVGETPILSRVGQYFAMTTSNLFCFEGISHLLFENSWKDQLKKQFEEEDPLASSNLGTELTNITLKPLFSLTSKKTI